MPQRRVQNSSDFHARGSSTIAQSVVLTLLMRIAILENEPAQMSHFIYTIERQLLAGDEPVLCVPFERGEDLRRALRRETFDLLCSTGTCPTWMASSCSDGCARGRKARCR